MSLAPHPLPFYCPLLFFFSWQTFADVFAVLGWYRTVNNPQVSQEAKDSAQDRLKDMGQ